MDTKLAVTLAALLLGVQSASVSSDWDFIVIGGGVAGCVAADILSASGRRTLLLESGPPGHAVHGGTEIPAEFAPYEAKYGRNLTVFDIPGEYHSIAWNPRYKQYNQPSTPWSWQANVLGGGGVVNGALTMVPPASDFESLAHLNWSYASIDPHFKQILSFMQAVNVPSADGLRYLEMSSDVLRTAFSHINFTSQALNEDPQNRANTFDYPPVTAVEGQRVSTCLRFLPHEQARPNFKLITNAVVDRVVLGEVHGRAIGVSYTQTGSNTSILATLAPSGRAVLTAGALNTPRLLMLSGIGPLDQLLKLEHAGLAPVKTSWIVSPGVGAALSDHVYLRMRFALPRYKNFNYQNLSLSSVEQYFKSLSGPLTQYGPVLAGYLASPFSSADSSVADMEVFMESYDASHKRTNMFDVYLMLLSPKSVTSLDLVVNVSADPKVSVFPKNFDDLYLKHPQDRAVFRWGIERMVTAFQGAFGGDLELITPVNASADEYDKLLNSHADSNMIGNHWAQTCALGSCVDPATLQVHGTDNVHVADASLLPKQLSSHPMLTVAAMARKSAQHILSSSGMAACSANPKCAAQGMVIGECCPSFDAVMLSCCRAD